MPEPVTIIALAGKAAATIAKSSMVDSIRDAAVNFLGEQAKSLGQRELSDRISRLRSDAALREQIRIATERAVKRWAQDYADRDLVAAVAESTTFADLPAVQNAVQTIAKRPFDPIAADTLRGEFAQVLPGNFESPRIERGVVAFLEILREELAGVAALRDALGVAAEIQRARSAQASVQLLQALLRLEQGPTATEQTLVDYLTWVVDQHRYLDPRGTMQTVRQVQVLLEEIYVSLQAEAEPAMGASDRRLFESELEALTKRDDLRAEEREDLRENLLAQYARGATPQPGKVVELGDLVNENVKLVILGDPGSGKTTLLRYLALQNAQALRRGDPRGRPGQAQGAAPTDARLPLYLRLANYAENNKGRSLADFMPAGIRGEADSDPTLADLIKTRLAQGTCLVLLDGLDEVIDPSQRAEIAQQVDAFIRAHERAGNRFVVASRVAGYRSAPLSGDIPHYRVCDMNDEQIRRFLDRWCRAVERSQTPDLSPEAQNLKAQGEIDGISQAIEHNPGVRRLAANPLLLRVLALIHRTGARLPQRRIELYRLAADTLIRDWELSRGIPESALVREDYATRLLADLGAWMHEFKPAGIATEGEVRGKLADVYAALEGKDADHPDVQAAVTDFLSRIRQHTGLFVERAPRRFGFMHLTVEEYFAARWLVAKPRDAARRIRYKLHRPRWEEPILLAISFYGMEFPDDVSDLVQEAILGKDLGGPSPYENILHRDLLFALRALGDQDVSAILRKKIVGDCYQLWMDDQGAGKYKPLRSQLKQTMQELQGSTAGKDLNDALLAGLRDPVADARANAADALGNAATQPEVVTALLTALRDPDAYVRGNAAVALGSATLSAEAIPVLLAALHDPDEFVRRNATIVLGNAAIQPEVVTALLTALRDPSEDVRAYAALALGNAKSQSEVLTALLATLNDPADFVRSNAADALGNAATRPEVATGLIKVLRDPDADVRDNAAYTLSTATTQPEVVTALLISLRDPDAVVRASAAGALGSAATHPEVVTALLTALHDPDESVRRNAAYALGNVTAHPEVVNALLAVLRDPDAGIRRNAAIALGNTMAQPEVANALLAALRDPDESVCRNAAVVLGSETARPEVVNALLTVLRDPDAGIRGNAAIALRNTVGRPEVANALLAALRDPDRGVRGYAAIALRNTMAQPEDANALLAALRDPDRGVRGYAANALGNATAQLEVVSPLLAALRDPDETVRQDAARSLAQLAGQATSRTFVELPQQLAVSLELPGIESPDWNRPSDNLFQALAAVAPGPEV